MTNNQQRISQSAYAAAGVDIEAKMGAFQRMRASVESTYTPGRVGRDRRVRRTVRSEQSVGRA